MHSKKDSGSNKEIRPSIWEPLDSATYHSWSEMALKEPESFWTQQAKRFLTWFKPWKKTMHIDLKQADIRWFEGGKINVAYNCLDRHLPQRQHEIAYYWEGDNGNRQQTITYLELYERVCRFANTLKKWGVKKGDIVCIYLPMIPDAIVAMLACSRIGAIHSLVFAGFSSNALIQRIYHGNSKYLITADDSIRNGRAIHLKEIVDEALRLIPNATKVMVMKNSGRHIKMAARRDVWYHEYSKDVSLECPPVWLDAEDPLFILYTSGSTGLPKGIIHTQGGYLLFAAMTHRYVFDYQQGDIYWSTADVGWITGHTYSVYGPLANGATSVIYEGVPTSPDPSFVWKIIDKYKVNIFYTAPTVIRALMAYGNEPLKQSTRSSLRILGTVGEPINPEAWQWYHDAVGNKKCWIVDTWWQTETGGILIAPLPYIGSQKPGSASLPFFGIKPAVLDANAQPVNTNERGALVIETSWPGQARTIYQDHERFKTTYFKQYPGKYNSGDGAYFDEDGDVWVTGRIDDVINVSGHRLSATEIESVLAKHPVVHESAVVGAAHAVKGEGLYAYVSLIDNASWSATLEQELRELVIKKIGKFAVPENIQCASQLPKTRSGKIMRRILRKIANNEGDNLGDISTLVDESVIEDLIKQHAS